MTLNLGARRWIAPQLTPQENEQEAKTGESVPKAGKNHAEEREREIIRRIRQKIAEQTPEGASREEQEALAQEIAWQETAELPKARREAIVREIVQSVGGGLGPLQPFVDDPAVTEIMVNAPDQVYIERNGEMVLTNVRFRSDEDVQGLVERIVGEIGRRFDLSNPMVDARLRDGSRVNAIRPPLALKGTAVTIRKFPRAFTFDDLVRSGAIPDGKDGGFDVAAALRWAVPNRLNIVVSGGTGSGKCLDGNMPVVLASGEQAPIRELVEREARGVWVEDADGWCYRLVDGLHVLAWDEATGTVTPKKVTAVWRGPAPKELIRIATAQGREIVVTGVHPLAVAERGGGIEWRAAALVVPGDLIAVGALGNGPVESAMATWDVVREVRWIPAQERYVYDLSVEGHTFLAGQEPVVVHNTTLLNALTGLIPHHERLVIIEDAAELQPQQPHVVRLETRPPTVEGKGEVRIRQLLVNALRMRPDRIIVGEVRSDEVVDMLQAMNTGHPGSMTTVHANSTRDCLTRLETMVLMGSSGEVPLRAVRQQIASAIHLIVQIARTRLPDGTVRRWVTELSAMRGLDPATDDYNIEVLYRRDLPREVEEGIPAWARPWFEGGAAL